jgi:kumamolisin
LTVVSDTQITVTTPVVATPLAVHVTVVNNVGSSNLSPADVFLFNDVDDEVALDIEVAGAVAPKAKMVVYFAPNNSLGWQHAVSAVIADTTNSPSIVSISWGAPEDGAFFTSNIKTAMETLFVQASQMTPKIVFLAASGDNGSGDGVADGNPHVHYPASSPNVTGCGGSVVTLSGTTWSSEVVWNTPNVGSTGGGVSTFPLPSWQSNANVPTLANGQTGRGVPDVCGHADSYKIVLRGVDTSAAGTSAVAPLWTGLLACLNEKVSGGLSADRFYATAVTAGFHDITSGTNGAYNAGTGWDACTGLGSPDGSKLLGLLTPVAPAVTAISPSSGSSAGGDTVTVTGTGFTGATAVNFGSDAGTDVNVVSDTQLTVTSPAASASGAVDVTVTTPAGTSATSSADQFTAS